MASTLNIDWLLGLAADLASDLGLPTERKGPARPARPLDRQSAAGGAALPPVHFRGGRARPVRRRHGARRLRRAGDQPPLRPSGPGGGRRAGAGRARLLRGDGRRAGRGSADRRGRPLGPAARHPRGDAGSCPVRTSSREEAGAAGAAMMAAVAIARPPVDGGVHRRLGQRRCSVRRNRPTRTLPAATPRCSPPISTPAARCSRCGASLPIFGRPTMPRSVAIIGDHFMLPEVFQERLEGHLRRPAWRSAPARTTGPTSRWSTATPPRDWTG